MTNSPADNKYRKVQHDEKKPLSAKNKLATRRNKTRLEEKNLADSKT